MSSVSNKRLGKDQRNKFIKEFEQDGKLSDPNYYAIKDKNVKVEIRRKKAEKADVEQKNKNQIKYKLFLKNPHHLLKNVKKRLFDLIASK